MDPELRAYLEAMEKRNQHQMEAMRAETRQQMEAMRAETRQQMEAMRAETRQQMEAMEKRAIARDAEARREAGVMFEAILKEIKALPEGLSTHQRREAERLDATREEAMLNEHVLPLEAVAADHEERIKALEQAH